jgi:hypothetical protein
MHIRRIRLAWKALQELGMQQVGLYALYQLGLRSGYYRIQCIAIRKEFTGSTRLRTDLLALPQKPTLQNCLGTAAQTRLLAEADEVVAGKVRLFGREQALPLELQTPGPLAHWTEIERAGHAEDIKFTWEMGRFGWVYPLGRAYHLNGNKIYAQAFWRYTETFLEANPPCLGPHWVSGQEVALRLIGMVWAAQVFAASPHSTPDRMAFLARAVAQHARRIPPTLIYARSQNNNHLLSEAAGLYTAGLALPEHPQARRWRELGWRWFERSLLAQVAEAGTYCQHSTNYHRLMLQLAMWVQQLAGGEGRAFAAPVQARLQAATRWLLALLDPHSGRVPNLGPNDGAYILPLTVCPFSDYRPVLQAAGRIFLGKNPCGQGEWDEMELWFGTDNRQRTTDSGQSSVDNIRRSLHGVRNATLHPATIRSSDGTTWAYLRAAHFKGRPGHADQLHLDLWWRGLNVARDAGTYRYNAPPPWDNALTHTAVHNTLSINGLEQMRRSGRFLYLDWAQAQIMAQDERSITARQDGYRCLGLLHERTVQLAEDRNWIVEDTLLPIGMGPQGEIQACLQWLLVDSEQFTAEGEENPAIEIVTGQGIMRLEVEAVEGVELPLRWQIVRAGEKVYGEGPVEPTWGWSSPTYGDKMPAISVRVYATASAAAFTGAGVRLKSRFIFRAQR